MAQARIARNAALILDAATDLVARQGWSAMAASAVARQAGLSPQPVTKRYGNRVGLASALWSQRLGPALVEALDRCLDEAGLLDPARLAPSNPPSSAEAFVKTMEELTRPDQQLLAAAELLVISTFEAPIQDAVQITGADQLRAWVTPTAVGLAPTLAARRLVVMALALGLIMLARRPQAATLDLRDELTRLFDALQTSREPVMIPAWNSARLTELTYATDDSILDALLQATVEQVSIRGFEGATVEAIGRDAGVAGSTIFLRHPTKLDLFIDAVTRQPTLQPMSDDDALAAIRAATGDAITEAATFRATLQPGARQRNAVVLECLRLTWHHDEMARWQETMLATNSQSEAATHITWALRVGGMALAPLIPDAWQLPVDFVAQLP